MAVTVTLSNPLAAGPVPSGCVVLIRAHVDVDGDPLAARYGLPSLYADGVLLADVPTSTGRDGSAEQGDAWFELTRPDGAHAIRASLNAAAGSTPTSNTLNITWGSGSCPAYRPTAPVLTAEPGYTWIDLAWTPFSAPADTPPNKAWIITRAAGADPAPADLYDYLDPAATFYRDHGQPIVPAGRPAGPLAPGVEYRYAIVPWVDDADYTAARSWRSNIAAATVIAAGGYALDPLRSRTD